MNEDLHLYEVVHQFQISGNFLGAVPFGAGHIHDSFCAAFSSGGVIERYLIQRINTLVFADPLALMDNLKRVTEHIASLLAHLPDRNRRVLQFVPARDNQMFHRNRDGHCWRAMRYIENTCVLQTVDTPKQAFRIAAAFGQFQEQLSSLAAPPLQETIPHFHDTPRRFADLERAIQEDAASRAKLVEKEIAFAIERKSITGILLNAGLPPRITHNDSKSNNVLLDDETGHAICVVDLDTVMPGLAVYDFGDMVRAMTSPAPEDERDLTSVAMRFPIFEALARGYLETAGGFLTVSEKKMLPDAGRIITFENGLRFLQDYLNGDTYYKVHREDQNLDRCRTQFKLVESIESQMKQMNSLVQSLL